MIVRVARRFGLQPRRLAGDTAYGAVGLLKWLVDRQITPHGHRNIQHTVRYAELCPSASKFLAGLTALGRPLEGPGGRKNLKESMLTFS